MGPMKRGLSFGARSKWAVTGAYRRDPAQARAPRHPGSRHVAWAGLPRLAQRLCRSPLAPVHAQVSRQAAMPVAAGSAPTVPAIPLCLAASGAQDQKHLAARLHPPPLAAPAVRRSSPELGAGWLSAHVRIRGGHAQPWASKPQHSTYLGQGTAIREVAPRPGSPSKRRPSAIALEGSPNNTLPEPIDGSLEGGTSASGHEAGLRLYPGPIPSTVREHAPGSRHLRPGELAPGEEAVVEIGVGVVHPVDLNRLERRLPWNLRCRVRPLKPPVLLSGKV